MRESGVVADKPVLLITGASSGIGSESARHAVEAGYRVALGARREEKVRALAEELGEERALAYACDVSEWDQMEGFVGATLGHFGRLDAVLANAGTGLRRGLLEDSVENWRSVVLTNVLGVAHTIRAVLPHFLEQDRGHLLVTSSVAGRYVLTGSLYSATKFAATALTEALRLELREVHKNETIRATVVAPGFTETPFFESMEPPAWAGLQSEDIAKAVVYALQQPDGVDVSEILIRSTSQTH